MKVQFAALLVLWWLVALASPVFAQGRALLIGIDTYGDPALGNGISGAASGDVALIRQMLTSTLGYKDTQIRVLVDQLASRAGILTNINEWLGSARPGERVYLYFAGLGYFAKDKNGDEKDGLDEALIPFDARVVGTGRKPAIKGMITDDELSGALRALEGRDVTVVLDTSHSGTVTRAKGNKGKFIKGARTPQFRAATRSISVEPSVVLQKAEGSFIESRFTSGSMIVWSAVAASQVALIDSTGAPHGVFTKNYVDGLRGKADQNGNGAISNAELLAYIAAKSKAYCGQAKDDCEMGLTPQLHPAGAHGAEAVLLNEKVAGGAALKPFVKGARKGKQKLARPTAGRLTIDKVTDFLGKGNTANVRVAQIPPTPVKVGTRDIRFQVTSPHDGYLILLNLTDEGQLIQLYPNQFTAKYTTGRTGRLRAMAPLTVPDDYYGLKFHATAPSAGYIVAIVTRDLIEFPKTVKTRKIEVIPAGEATNSFLPQISSALGKSINSAVAGKNTGSADWSVATMRYEILP